MQSAEEKRPLGSGYSHLQFPASKKSNEHSTGAQNPSIRQAQPGSATNSKSPTADSGPASGTLGSNKPSTGWQEPPSNRQKLQVTPRKGHTPSHVHQLPKPNQHSPTEKKTSKWQGQGRSGLDSKNHIAKKSVTEDPYSRLDLPGPRGIHALGLKTHDHDAQQQHPLLRSHGVPAPPPHSTLEFENGLDRGDEPPPVPKQTMNMLLQRDGKRILLDNIQWNQLPKEWKEQLTPKLGGQGEQKTPQPHEKVLIVQPPANPRPKVTGGRGKGGNSLRPTSSRGRTGTEEKKVPSPPGGYNSGNGDPKLGKTPYTRLYPFKYTPLPLTPDEERWLASRPRPPIPVPSQEASGGEGKQTIGENSRQQGPSTGFV